MNTKQNIQVRTHTYWMTVKEYKKWSKSKPAEIKPFSISSKSSSKHSITSSELRRI